MKKEFNKMLLSFSVIIIFSVLIFNVSCSKNTNQNSGQTITGNAKIIYTDVSPDSAILSTTDSFNLDLNNDGITDFVFKRTTYGGECGGDDLFGYGYRYYINLSVVPANGKNEVMTNGDYALALDSATAIIADSIWTTVSQTLINGMVSALGRCNGLPAYPSGNWISVSERYLGLKFIKDNNTYYGWARLSSSYARKLPGVFIIGGHLTLKDYAYNSIPNQPILAGQTK
jgi:hypothetical protein